MSNGWGPKRRIVKARWFSEDMLLPNKENLKVHYALLVIDEGVGKKPLLQLNASGNSKQFVWQDSDDNLPALDPTEYGANQMHLVAAARRRLHQATKQELRNFRKGSYIQIHTHAE